MALFTKSEMSRAKLPLTLVAECGACGLYKGCKSPKMKPTGSGLRRVMVVGEAPDDQEDEVGKQFVGESGQLLRDHMRAVGVNLDRDCVVTNSAICRPPNNKLPEKAVVHCRANVLKAVKEHDPEVVLLLGAAPLRSLVGHLWREDPGGITRWAGFRVPCVEPNAWVCPTFHPAFLLRAKDPVPAMMFRKHLAAAFALKGRPWSEKPDYEREVEVEFDGEKAAKVIRAMAAAGRPVAFDYETNMLKPDSPNARIACVAVSDGGRTISALWGKSVANAMLELLGGKVPLVGWNMKFESRWSKRILGKWPKGWVHDGMQFAHVLDYRTGVSGLKFQSFVRLGVTDYAEHVRPYLQAKDEEGGNAENRVFELVRTDARSLLTYCGIDALLEWKVWSKQKEETGGKAQT